MATTDYLILQAQTEFRSSDTPRIFYKLGAAAVGTIGMAIVKPNGTTGTPVAMTQLGVGVLSQSIYYADISDAYALGQWSFVCADDNDTAGTAQYGSIQWGGIVDLLASGALNTEQLTPGNAVYDSVANTETLMYQTRDAFVFDEGGASGKLTLMESDGTTPFAHWLCYSDAARTTLATTWASVVARGPFVVGA